MQKVTARVIGRPILKTAVGGTVSLSPRDARILESLGRVEIVPPAEDVEFSPSPRLNEAAVRALASPETAPLNVAHIDEPRARRAHKSRRKG